MKYWYVYKILFDDNTYYIGYRSSKVEPLNDLGIKYFSSSKLVKEKIKISKPNYEILYVYNNQENAYHTEQEIIFSNIDDNLLLNKVSYLNRKGFGILSKSAKEILSVKTKERWNDNSYRELMSEKQSKSWTPERKQKHSETMKNLWTDEKRRNHSNKLLGHTGSIKLRGQPKPDGFGEKISKSLKGVPKSKEHKEKMRLAALKRHSKINLL